MHIFFTLPQRLPPFAPYTNRGYPHPKILNASETTHTNLAPDALGAKYIKSGKSFQFVSSETVRSALRNWSFLFAQTFCTNILRNIIFVFNLIKIFVCIFCNLLTLKYIHIGDDNIMKFEIKHDEYVNKTFRFPKDLADRLAIASNENNCSMNEFVCQAVEFALQNMKEESE